MEALTKDYPVFDCDAHVTESPEMWNYLSASEKELVKNAFWPQGAHVLVNGNTLTPANWGHGRAGEGAAPKEGRRPNVLEVAGPGVTKPLLRKLYTMNLSNEQIDYIEQTGAPTALMELAYRLAVDDSDYVNGVTLFVDGGMTLYPEFASGG